MNFEGFFSLISRYLYCLKIKFYEAINDFIKFKIAFECNLSE